MSKRMIFKRYIFIFFTFFLHATLFGQQIKIGNYTFSDGGEYQGELFKGKPYGQGTTTFPNGDVHTGSYVKGKRQGQGVYQFSDGEKYEGEWFQNQQHGQGTSPTTINMWGCGSEITSRGKAPCIISTVTPMWVTGSRTSVLERVSIRMRTELPIRGCGKTIRRTVMESLTGTTVTVTRESGKRI